jgi:hypothetical protein
MRGCAGDARGEILVSVDGSVCVFGKRMGDMNGLGRVLVS